MTKPHIPPDPGNPLSGTIMQRDDGVVRGTDLRIRDAQILDWKSRGYHIRDIAREFGLATSTVEKAIRRALAVIPSKSAEEVRRMADIALDRNLQKLNEVLDRVHWAHAANGNLVIDPETGDPLIDDGPVILAAREIREHWESRRKMHAADIPSVKVTAQIPAAVMEDRIRALQAATGTSGIDDPAVRELLGDTAVRQLLGIEAPAVYPDGDDDEDG